MFGGLGEMIKAIGRFKYKCICLWSKDDKYGFIPFTNCPVHGKAVRKMLKNTVEIKDNRRKNE